MAGVRGRRGKTDLGLVEMRAIFVRLAAPKQANFSTRGQAVAETRYVECSMPFGRDGLMTVPHLKVLDDRTSPMDHPDRGPERFLMHDPRKAFQRSLANIARNSNIFRGS